MCTFLASNVSTLYLPYTFMSQENLHLQSGRPLIKTCFSLHANDEEKFLGYQCLRKCCSLLFFMSCIATGLDRSTLANNCAVVRLKLVLALQTNNSVKMWLSQDQLISAHPDVMPMFFRHIIMNRGLAHLCSKSQNHVTSLAFTQCYSGKYMLLINEFNRA